jgi:hypothetical protein
MFFDDSPLCVLLNVGMWATGFWLGSIHGRNTAFRQVSTESKEREIQQLRRELEELKRIQEQLRNANNNISEEYKKRITPPPIPAKP